MKLFEQGVTRVCNKQLYRKPLFWHRLSLSIPDLTALGHRCQRYSLKEWTGCIPGLGLRSLVSVVFGKDSQCPLAQLLAM